MYLHNLDPIAIEIFSLKIYWYSLSYFFGFLLSIYYSKFLIRKNNLVITEKNIDDFLSWAVLGVVFGGRLGYVFFYNINFYSNNILEIFKIWNGGMSFHGGFIGVVIAVIYTSKTHKIPIMFFSDLISIVSPIGIFFGRIANFINSELYGHPVNIFWSVIFQSIDNVPRHPSQLYEALSEGLLLFIILNFINLKKNMKTGCISSLFLILYGIFRIFCEQFRVPDEQIGYMFELISMGSLLSFAMITLGIFIFTRLK